MINDIVQKVNREDTESFIHCAFQDHIQKNQENAVK